jgi:hypothetical protein
MGECAMIPKILFMVSMTTHKMHDCYLTYLESNQGKHQLPTGRLLRSLSQIIQPVNQKRDKLFKLTLSVCVQICSKPMGKQITNKQKKPDHSR